MWYEPVTTCDNIRADTVQRPQSCRFARMVAERRRTVSAGEQSLFVSVHPCYCATRPGPCNRATGRPVFLARIMLSLYPMKTLFRLLAITVLAAVVACDSDSNSDAPIDGAVFVVEVESGEQFRILLRNEAQIAEAEALIGASTQKIVNGQLLPGDGGFNDPWSWHMDPESVSFADVTIELCDGRPSMVEADLDMWLNTVGRFCPWSSRIVAREE